MTLSDLHGQSPIVSLLNAIFRTVVQQLTRFQLTARRVVPLRWLSFLHWGLSARVTSSGTCCNHVYKLAFSLPP